ncbi:UDP-N-acetylglucosamine transferase subunit ALG14 [Blattella germanica]|nr:UDP-N-acetylglucosamine transferase subunit ALG14 [Blattella germanica]
MYLIYKVQTGVRNATKNRVEPVKTAVIIGSGGHTTEMLRLIKNINPLHFSPRIYIMASSDTTSEVKIHASEGSKSYEIVKIPRSRRVGQSYVSSVFTTLYAFLASFPIMIKSRPDLILCNGPGTCIPICAIAFLMRLLFLADTRIVFIESICRVKSLSLTGKILLLFADEIIVQWPKLQATYPRTKFMGRLA